LRVAAYSDSDHVGCATTRRSTSCYALFLGGICLRVGSGTQKVVATSSAEAEFYAGTRAASALLGAQRLLGDLGMERRLDVPRLLLDATGGIGIILRRGIGAVKHLATSTLWLQGAAFRRELEIDKVGTDRNVSDIGTKPLTSSVFWRHLWAMGIHQSWWPVASGSGKHLGGGAVNERADSPSGDGPPPPWPSHQIKPDRIRAHANQGRRGGPSDSGRGYLGQSASGSEQPKTLAGLECLGCSPSFRAATTSPAPKTRW
jgi:hypothetical protein